MTDLLRMADISSNNPPPNLHEHWKAGYRVLALKCTEGTSYVWHEGADLAHEWHRLGGRVVHYHFARPGNAKAQADHYLKAVAGRLADGDLLCIDAEVTGVGGAFVEAFITRCHDKRPNHHGLVYGPPYFLRDNHIRPAHGWGLWVAQYASKVSLIPPGWQTWDAWQFSQTAQVPGMVGHTDHSKIRKHLLPAPLSTKERDSAQQLIDELRGKAVAAHDRKLLTRLRTSLRKAFHR